MKCNKCDMKLQKEWNYCPYCKNKINSINLLDLNNDIEQLDNDICEKCGITLNSCFKICPKCGGVNSFYSQKDYDNNSEIIKINRLKEKQDRNNRSKLWILLDIFCLTFSFPFNLIYYYFILGGLGSSVLNVFKTTNISDLIWSLIKLPVVGVGTWIGLSVVAFFSLSVFISSIYNVFVAKSKSIIWKMIFWLNILSGFIIVLFFVILGIIF